MREQSHGDVIGVPSIAAQFIPPGPGVPNPPGDPARAAAEIIQLAQLEEPPMRLVLGKAANQTAEQDLNQQLDDLMEWEHLGLDTDFVE